MAAVARTLLSGSRTRTQLMSPSGMSTLSSTLLTTSTMRLMVKCSRRWRRIRVPKVRVTFINLYLSDAEPGVLAGQTPEFYDVPYYMILNTAVGGPWPGEPNAQTKFPLYHYIDYVHVAQPSGQA